MHLTNTPLNCFDKITLDTVGPLPKTPDGFRHVLTMQCLLTKYCVAVPVPNIKAVTIAHAFATNFIAIYGSPGIVLSDKGTSFLNQVFHELAKIFKIQHITSSGYRPQTQGSLERSHIVLTEYLKQAMKDFEDWDKLIPFAMFSYNTSTHESTNFTPYEMVFGRQARAPSSFPTEEGLETYTDYVVELVNRLNEIQNLGAKNLIKAKLREKQYYDRDINSVSFQPGDLILVLREPKRHKFESQYVGPFEVIELTERGDIIFRDNDGVRFIKHPNKVKLFHTE